MNSPFHYSSSFTPLKHLNTFSIACKVILPSSPFAQHNTFKSTLAAIWFFWLLQEVCRSVSSLSDFQIAKRDSCWFKLWLIALLPVKHDLLSCCSVWKTLWNCSCSQCSIYFVIIVWLLCLPQARSLAPSTSSHKSLRPWMRRRVTPPYPQSHLMMGTPVYQLLKWIHTQPPLQREQTAARTQCPVLVQVRKRCFKKAYSSSHQHLILLNLLWCFWYVCVYKCGCLGLSCKRELVDSCCEIRPHYGRKLASMFVNL